MIIFCLFEAPCKFISNAVGQCSVVYSREGPPLGGAGLGDISGVNCLHTIYEIFITALTTRHNGRHPPRTAPLLPTKWPIHGPGKYRIFTPGEKLELQATVIATVIYPPVHNSINLDFVYIWKSFPNIFSSHMTDHVTN